MPRPLRGILRNCILWLLVLTACVGLTCQRRPQTAKAANGTDGLMKFALQVGIDDYQYVSTLDGCVQDILDMKPVLVKKFGFPEANIVTLTNRQATHAAIVEAFKTHLIGNAKKHPNAIVVFQYSGHGSQTDDGNGDEGDKLDETLVSVDSRDPQNKVFDITDDELNNLFEQLSQFTSNITFILDSCHSGSATRGENKVRRVSKDVRPQPPQPPLSSGSSSSQTRDGERVDVLPRNERYVTISGSRSTEVSNERRERFALKTNGAMTFHLLRALQRAKPETTYRELMEEVAKAVTLEFPAQHPQFEGDIRRSVFGGAANREDPFIRITAVKGKTITLDAGAAQGIKEGTPIAIYAPDAQRLSGPEKNLGTATVTKVATLTSTAEAREVVAIPANAKAVLMSPNYGSTKLRVALDASRAGAASANVIAGIRDELKTSNTIEIVNSPAASSTSPAGASGWDVALFAGKFGEVFTDKNSIAPAAAGDAALPADDANVYYVAASDGIPLFGFFVKDNDANGPQKIAEALDQLARLRVLKALSNDVRSGGQGIRITPIRVFGKLTDDGFKTDREEVVSTDQPDFAFDQGEHFKFKIENQSGKDMYITLFDVSTDGSIQILYPPEGAGELVKNGDQITLQSVFETTGPAGYETFKIIGTTDLTNFSFLTQKAVSRGTSRSPLESLMDVALVRTRAKVTKVASVDDWTTSQIDFVISEKKKS
jgi:caspase domain-containing protein/uncharacterized protein DUF4384